MKAIIIGMSSTGKSSVQKMLTSWGFVPCVSHTTRPIRSNEKEGLDYHFIDEAAFTKLMKSMVVFEYFEQVGWFYGKNLDNILASHIIVTTPGELPNVVSALEQREKEFQLFLLEASDEIRRTRSLQRGDKSSEVERRILADNKDFANVKENFFRLDPVVINTEDFSVQEIASQIASFFNIVYDNTIKFVQDVVIENSEVSFTVSSSSGELQSIPIADLQIVSE
jgi:guanylate kinase